MIAPPDPSGTMSGQSWWLTAFEIATPSLVQIVVPFASTRCA